MVRVALLFIGNNVITIATLNHALTKFTPISLSRMLNANHCWKLCAKTVSPSDKMMPLALLMLCYGGRSGQNSMNYLYQYRINKSFCSLIFVLSYK